MITLFLKGLLIGLAIAAPVGPIGILCIQRSLHDGFKVGLMTGMGAALADGTYGLVAGFGLTSISSLLIAYQFWVRLFGGLFLLYLAIKLFFKIPQQGSSQNFDRSPWHAFFTIYLLTLTNPATIFAFVAIFAGLGLGAINFDYMHAIILVVGITLGSVIWWILLSGVVARTLHHRLTASVMQKINRISGMIIFIFAVFALSMK